MARDNATEIVVSMQSLMRRVSEFDAAPVRAPGRPVGSKYAALIVLIRSMPGARLDAVLARYRQTYGRSIAEGSQPNVDKKIISRERARLKIIGRP